MWFRRAPRNRRLARENVLEVKLRTQEVRAARLRLAATALSVALGTVVGLFLLWRAGEWVLDRCVFGNPAFAIRELDIQTDGVLSRDTLRRWSGVKPGENLLALDLNRVKRDLELVPLIGSASIHRVPPGTLRIRVAERVPVASVRLLQLQPAGGVDTVTYYLDATGHVLEVAPNAEPALKQFFLGANLPHLVGVDGNWLRPGRATESPSVRAALRLLTAFTASPMYGAADPVSVDVSRPDALEVTTAQGSRVTFGLDSPELQLARWWRVHQFASRQGKVIQTLDLSVTNNAPAVLLDASTAPDGPLPPAKPTSTRKPHV